MATGKTVKPVTKDLFIKVSLHDRSPLTAGKYKLGHNNISLKFQVWKNQGSWNISGEDQGI